MKAYRLTLTATAFYAALPCSAFAQQPTAAQAPASATATVEVKSTADSARRNDAANRQVINREEIARYGDASVLDAMKRLPGVTVNGTSVRMRGLGSGYTQLLVDGQPAPAGFTLDGLAPDMVERIEIIRSATAEYSTQAIAGTINIVLRKAPRTDGRELKLANGLAGRQSEPSITGTWSAKHADGSHQLTASLRHLQLYPTYEYSEEVRRNGVLADASTVHTDQQVHYTALNLQPRLTWALAGGDNVDWQTTLNAGRSRGGSDKTSETIAGQGQAYPNLNLGFGIDNASLRTEAGWTRSFASGARAETKAAAFTSISDRWMWRDATGTAGQLLLDRDFLTKVHERGTTWTGKFAAATTASGHAPVAGWDVGHTVMTSHDVQEDALLPGIPESDYDTRIDARVDRLALYAQDEWDIDTQWSAYLGLRTEALRVRTTSTEAGEAHTSSYRIASPIAQVLWKLPGKQRRQVRLALTRTFRAPPLARITRGYFYTTDNTPISPDQDGNPNLQPETARGIDTGVEWYWSEGTSLVVNGSQRAISNLIRDRITLQGLRWVSAPANIGHADVRTLEVEAKAPLHILWAAAPKVDLRANWVRNWSSVDGIPGPDNRLDGQPRWSATMGADYRGAAWSAGATLASVAGGWTRSSIENRGWTNTRHALDAYASFTLAHAGTLRISASNLLRTTDRSMDIQEDASGSWSGINWRPTWAVLRLQYTGNW